MVSLFPLILLLLLLLSIQTYSKSLQKIEDNLSKVDHVKLSKSRIIIDEAITESQHRLLMNYVHQDPVLSLGEAKLTYQENGVTINHKFSLRNLFDIYIRVKSDLGNSFKGKVSETNRQERVMNYTSTLRYLHMMKTILNVQLQIVAYAESFFNRTFGIKGGTFFLRKKVKIDRITEYSPREVNNGTGWLFPPHVDGLEQKITMIIIIIDIIYI